MKIASVSLTLLLLLLIQTSSLLAFADDQFWNGENDPVYSDYGIVKCWFSTDNLTWQEATVDLAELKLGEPFYIKSLIKAKKDLNVMSLRISGFGSNQDFEVLNGPSNLGNTFSIWMPIKNETHELIWNLCVKPDTNWVGGNSPINMDVQFTTNEGYTLPPFTIVNVYILDELWEGYVEDNYNNDNINDGSYSGSTPGFEIIVSFLTIALIVFYKRKI